MGEMADYFMGLAFDEWCSEDWWDNARGYSYYAARASLTYTPTPGWARPPLKLAEPEDFPLVL